MNCVELSIESLKSKAEELGKNISDDYDPDVIIFIAKGGYPVAKPIQEMFNAELVGIEAVRSGNKLKELLVPVLKRLPDKIKNILRKAELKSGIHNMKTERNVRFHKKPDNSIQHKFLVVDDSVDTGYTMKAVCDEIRKNYPSAEVRYAALNVWDKSKEVIETDYTIYSNTIIKTPMSKDSKEYTVFLNMYDKYLKDNDI